MPVTDRVRELLAIWERAGRKLTPEELCWDSPTLLDEIREHIQRLQVIEGGAPVHGHRHPRPIPVVEGYEIVRPLGEGGMGVVWEAIQKGTQRPVALKLLSVAALTSDKARIRFSREVQLAAALNHPYVAHRLPFRPARGNVFLCHGVRRRHSFGPVRPTAPAWAPRHPDPVRTGMPGGGPRPRARGRSPRSKANKHPGLAGWNAPRTGFWDWPRTLLATPT